MKKSSTEGIVLHSRETGEGDIIVRIYTEEFGLINAIFKGLKKSSKRSHACAEAGTVSSFIIPRVHDDKFSIIQDASLIEHHSSTRNSLRKIVHLNFLSELILKTTPPHSRDQYLYRMLRAVFDTLETTEKEYHLAVFFTLHMLRHHGILPVLETCGACKKNNPGSYHLSSSEKIVLCETCARIPKASFLRIGERERIFAVKALARKYSACDLESITEEEASSLLFALLMYTESYYHTEFMTKTFLFSDELLEREPIIM
jgi:DNA repair protein RecO